MNDDDLLSQVRAAFDALDPVPGEVLAASRSAFAWRMPSAGLAELTGDRDRPAAGVRGGAEAATRSLAFAGAGLTVEIEATGTGRTREITGRLVPAAPAVVHVRHLDLPPGDAPGDLMTRTDPGGMFSLPRVPEGLVSLVFRLPDATSVVTSWIRL